MTLTLSYGPLSNDPAPTNYTIDGPAHRILVHEVGKRVRIAFGGETVVDTTGAKMLHESNMLPVYYVPREDVRSDVLERTDHSTHCPFKGDASYWSLRVGDEVAENAVWGYEQPNEELPVLDGLVALYLDRMDAVYEEDEEIIGHPRDPFHRVDVRRSGRRVRVLAGAEVLADTTRAAGVFETGLPTRWYIPTDDVKMDRLSASDTTTVCPYKGVASYWSFEGAPGEVASEDVAWGYAEPLSDGQGLEGHVCFLGDGIVTEVDGQEL
jgi:uncharacterized protein (DUF427 family)